MRVLYFHQHFSTLSGTGGIRAYQMAKKLLLRGHHVTVICGSSSRADTGLSAATGKGIRRGLVEGIDVIEILLPYSNYDNLIKRSITFLKYAIRSTFLAIRINYDLAFASSLVITSETTYSGLP